MTAPDTLTIAQAAERAGVNRSTLTRAMRDGSIPVPLLKIGKSVRVPKARFLAYLAGDVTSPVAATGLASIPPSAPDQPSLPSAQAAGPS